MLEKISTQVQEVEIYKSDKALNSTTSLTRPALLMRTSSPPPVILVVASAAVYEKRKYFENFKEEIPLILLSVK